MGVGAGLYMYVVVVQKFTFAISSPDEFLLKWRPSAILTRQKASTSMYSLTFCVRLMSPERHHWKPAVQAAAVMLRTPPVDGQLPASKPRLIPIQVYGAQF